MAEETQVLHSVEIDAAPSVEFVNLSSLDIGSECIVETESKPESKKSVHDVVQEEDETEPSSDINDGSESVEQELGQNEQDTDRNLEYGLGSLNLKETFEPEVTVDGEELEKALLHQDSDGDTLLHTLVISQEKDLALQVIKVMKKMLVSPDLPNRLQQTALHLAVLNGLADVVRALVLAGASPFARDHQLRTPMLVACEKGAMTMLREIIQNVNWNMRDSHVISKLLNPSTHALDLPNADGERCLHLAVRHNNVEMAKELLDNGADPNLPDRRSGRTPLHVAADIGHVQMTKFLISVDNIDINQRTYNVETALEIAHMRERQEVVVVLKPLSFPVKKRKSKNDIGTG